MQKVLLFAVAVLGSVLGSGCSNHTDAPNPPAAAVAPAMNNAAEQAQQSGAANKYAQEAAQEAAQAAARNKHP